jgi:hypothetical protein
VREKKPKGKAVVTFGIQCSGARSNVLYGTGAYYVVIHNSILVTNQEHGLSKIWSLLLIPLSSNDCVLGVRVVLGPSPSVWMIEWGLLCGSSSSIVFLGSVQLVSRARAHGNRGQELQSNPTNKSEVHSCQIFSDRSV